MPCGYTAPNDEEYENYDPSKPVCQNQDDFNTAFRKAIEHNNKENMRKSRPWIYIYGILWIIFCLWAIMIAIRTTTGQERTVHLTFAILFPPVYIIASYLGMFDKM